MNYYVSKAQECLPGLYLNFDKENLSHSCHVLTPFSDSVQVLRDTSRILAAKAVRQYCKNLIK